MPDQVRKYLVFSLGGALYALDLKHIAEVGDPPRLWPIPMASSCYHGALNFHGTIVAALHLPFLMGITGCSKPQKIIILHRDIAALAFLVDNVVRIISGEEVSVGPPPVGVYSTATLSLTDCEATLLDLDRLVSDAEQCVHKSSLTTKISAYGKNS